jgi:hypothetical protein
MLPLETGDFNHLGNSNLISLAIKNAIARRSKVILPEIHPQEAKLVKGGIEELSPPSFGYSTVGMKPRPPQITSHPPFGCSTAGMMPKQPRNWVPDTNS